MKFFHLILSFEGRGCDMVLGIGWIDLFAQVVLNTKPHSLSFQKEGKIITLWGINEKPKVSPINREALRRILQCGTCETMAEICMMNFGNAAFDKIVIDPVVERLLSTYIEVFQEPTELPPKRSCDHAINLIPRAQPFNLRPYRYSHDQKNAIESIINDMLEAETVVPS